MSRMHRFIAGMMFLQIVWCPGRAAAGTMPGSTGPPGVNLIPKPEEVKVSEGYFLITGKTRIDYSSESGGIPFAVDYLAAQLRRATGFTPVVRPGDGGTKTGVISFERVREEGLGSEGYRLVVGKDRVQVRANSDAGYLYAIETLLQLLPPEILGSAPPDVVGSAKTGTVQWKIPCVSIKDSPRFGWRGMHLDVSRHFFPKEFITRCIDMLVRHKMNTFHWHLTDDQGWRIEIKKYPGLTQVGAWRVDREDREWNAREPQRADEKATYGGFYTQDEIREIVQYAERRNVTIVPEIEMPAHTTAALAAYPQYSCTGGPFSVVPGGLWPISDIYCAGNDSAFTFLQNVLLEVMDLFPSKYIHIGGDEADKARWKQCPKCQARMKQEGLRDENELQSYFVKRIGKFLQSKNRRMVGWDEILDGGLAPDATVMSWRGMEGGIAAARLGHDVVMTPGSHCYFNSYQGKPEYEPPAGGGLLPITTVYSFEPVPSDLTPGQAQHILGGQSCLWTEYVSTPAQAEYMMLPRMAAMAEVLWSSREGRSWGEFVPRLEQQMKRYDASKYSFAKSMHLVSISPSLDTLRKKLRIALSTETGSAGIRYTLDGSDPSAHGTGYNGPFMVKRTLTVRAVALRGGRPLSAATSQQVLVHKGAMKPVALKHRYDKYTGGGDFALTNGLRGTRNYDDGNWQGYEQNDLEATIDLGEVMPLTKITAGFLQNTHSWIFFPTSVLYSVSQDGNLFTTVGRFDIPVPAGEQEIGTKDLGQPLTSVKARYIRVVAKNVGICPDWHMGRGSKAWMFVDEIIVE